MPFYIRHLPCKIAKLFDKDKSNIPKNHVFFNPSFSYPIIYIRGVNQDKFRDDSYVLLHNVETNKLSVIESPSELLEKNVNLYTGIEDLRICFWKNKLWFTATCTHASKIMNNELLIGHFDEKLSKVERMNTVDIGSLPVKNICPFVHDGKLLLLDIFLKCIYQFSEDPLSDEEKQNKIYERKPKFVATKILDLSEGSGITFDKFRGSSSPVHISGNTWGCVIHDIIFNDTEKLVTRLSYIHHWMEFDILTGVVTFLSSAFWCAHWGIEWCGGCHYDKEKDIIQLYIGISDQDCIVAETNLWNLRVGK